MPNSVTARNTAGTALTVAADRISLHTADPGTTGASEVSGGSYARVATVWGAWSAGASVGSQVTINVPAATTITHCGIWTSGGTFYSGGTLSASEAFALAGTYLLTVTYQVTA